MVNYEKKQVSDPNTCVIMLKYQSKVSIIEYQTFKRMYYRIQMTFAPRYCV